MSGRLRLRWPDDGLRVSGKGRVPFRDRALDGHSAGEGAGGGGERSHDAVAGVLDLGPTVDVQGVTENRVMRAQDLLGLVVTQSLGERGGALHVREQDGLEPAAHLRPGLRPFLAAQELLDGADQWLCVPQRDDVDVALQWHEAGAGDTGGDLASLLEGAGLVAATMEH